MLVGVRVPPSAPRHQTGRSQKVAACFFCSRDGTAGSNGLGFLSFPQGDTGGSHDTAKRLRRRGPFFLPVRNADDGKSVIGYSWATFFGLGADLLPAPKNRVPDGLAGGYYRDAEGRGNAASNRES